MNSVPYKDPQPAPAKPKPSRDPLIMAQKKAWRSSQSYRLGELLSQRTRWQRKFTIAQNKLADVNEAIAGLCLELARAADGVKEEKKP